MEINLNNYEAFFLDYYEGKLKPEQSELLFQFLEQHPELRQEFNSFENIALETEEISFNEKNSLIKPEVTHFNYENYLIAEAEGDLSENEKRALDNFLVMHSEYNKDKILYSKLKVAPDNDIIFNLKENLKKVEKKPTGKIIYLYRSIAVAASVILAAFFFIQINNTKVSTPVAEVKSENKNELNPDSTVKINNAEEGNVSTLKTKINVAAKEEFLTEKEIKTSSPQKVNSIKEEENQVAFTPIDKIKPVVTNEIEQFTEAPVFEIAEKIELPEEEMEPAETDQQQTLAQAAINTVEQIFSGERNQEGNAATSVVELAANGLNKLTGKELVSFEKKYNEEGQLKKVQITAGNFGISRSRNR